MTPPCSNDARDPDRRAGAERLVQPDDDVARTVVGELDRLDVRRPLDAHERLDRPRPCGAAAGGSARTRPRRPPRCRRRAPARSRSTCRPWSVSGSGNSGARSRLSRTRGVRAAALARRPGDVVAVGRVVGQRRRRTRPRPRAPTGARTTSNRAASQVVFSWVGRTTWPNWVSYAAWSVCTSTSKAALSNFSRSCQSTSVSISTRSPTEPDPLRWLRIRRRRGSPRTVVAVDRRRRPSREVGDLAPGRSGRGPRRPTSGVVGVQLQQVRRTAGRQHLTTGRLVEHATGSRRRSSSSTRRCSFSSTRPSLGRRTAEGLSREPRAHARAGTPSARHRPRVERRPRASPSPASASSAASMMRLQLAPPPRRTSPAPRGAPRRSSEPGRMSWNWCSSTIRQISSSSSAG